VKDATSIHPSERAATGTDADDVETLQAYPMPRQSAVRGDRRLAVDDQ